jgi:hypothetical protein
MTFFLTSPFPSRWQSRGDDTGREVNRHDDQAGQSGRPAADDLQAALGDTGRSWSSCRKVGTGPLRVALPVLGRLPEVIQQLSGLHVQALGEAKNRGQSRLPRAALHAPDRGRVNVCRVSKGILREVVAIP